MADVIGVYGAGGCARGLMPILRQQRDAQLEKLVFIDDAPDTPTHVNGHDVVSWNDFLDLNASSKSVCLGIANSYIRAKLASQCDAAGIQLRSLCADNVIIMDSVVIGEGACLSPFVTLASNIRIGRGFHANLYSYVEHDCTIGDFVTFAPGAKCNGNVQIGDFAYIGSNAVIKQGLVGKPLIIGAGATVGMGAVVTKDVPEGATVIGNPAIQMENKQKC
jgi:sugar O-acyltransferase (sialic acid O-acetyltransferase NeuD family)